MTTEDDWSLPYEHDSCICTIHHCIYSKCPKECTVQADELSFSLLFLQASNELSAKLTREWLVKLYAKGILDYCGL
jgi:hypothetical protein